MGKFSRDKGQRAERKVIDALQEVLTSSHERWSTKMPGADIDLPILKRNTMQSDGGGFDVHGIEWLAIEVKHHETLNVEAWWKQCVAQARSGQTPVLIYKQNNVKFRVRMPLFAQVGHERVGVLGEISFDDFLVYFRMRYENALRACTKPEPIPVVNSHVREHEGWNSRYTANDIDGDV